MAGNKSTMALMHSWMRNLSKTVMET